MLMAAGLGTRLRPFTDLRSKALLPLLGTPIIQYAIDALAEAKITDVAVNFHHLPEDTLQGLRALQWNGMRTRYSDERGQILGSGGGVRQMMEHLPPGPFFYLNADVVCDLDLRALGSFHKHANAQYGATVTLAIFQNPPKGGRYREVIVNPQTNLITSLGSVVENRPYFIGAAVLEPEAAAHLPLGAPLEFVPEILEPAIRAGKAAAFCTSGLWFDIGDPQLWLKSHVELIKHLEDGHLTGRVRHRIELMNQRVNSGFWASANAKKGWTPEWSGPAYWHPENGSTAPAVLGPNAVLYGEPPPINPLSNGIGFGGMWVERSSETQR